MRRIPSPLPSLRQSLARKATASPLGSQDICVSLQTTYPTQQTKKRLFCGLVFIFGILISAVASTVQTPRRGLILSSEDPNRPAIVILSQAIRETFKDQSPVRVQLYVEALDSARIPDQKFEQEMVYLLQLKYGGESIA